MPDIALLDLFWSGVGICVSTVREPKGLPLFARHELTVARVVCVWACVLKEKKEEKSGE